MVARKIRFFDVELIVILALGTGILLIGPVGTDHLRTFLTNLVLVFTLIELIRYRGSFFRYRSVVGLSVIIIFVFLFQTFRASHEFEYTAQQIYYLLRQYWWILIGPLVASHMQKYSDFIRILKIVVHTTIVSLVIRTFSWFFARFIHIVLFKNIVYEYGISWSRNGAVRIDATPLISIAIFGSLFLFLKYKKNIFIFETMFSFLYLCFVTQTRMLILGYLIGMTAVFIFKKSRTGFGKVLKFLLIVGGTVVSATYLWKEVLSYLGLASGVEGLEYRYYEFNYYFSLISQGKWVAGTGILSSTNLNSAKLLAGNLNTPMYLDDLGFFGLFIQIGLLSIVVYLLLYTYIVKTIIAVRAAGMQTESLFLIGIFAFILFVSFSLDLFGIQRILSVGFILAFCDFLRRASMSAENSDIVV
jgi:hypothetical protein